MRNWALLISIILSWVAYDRHSVRARQANRLIGGGEISLIQDGEQLRQKQQFEKQLGSVIPPWLRGAKAPLRSKCRWQGTQSRDVRSLDQRKIRRKCINM